MLTDKQISGLCFNSAVLAITLSCLYKETRNVYWKRWGNWNMQKKNFTILLCVGSLHLFIDIIESIQCTEENCNGFPVSAEANYVIHTTMLILWIMLMCLETFIFCINLLLRATKLLSILQKGRLKFLVKIWRIALFCELFAIFVIYTISCFFYGPSFSTENAPIKSRPEILDIVKLLMFVLTLNVGAIIIAPFDLWVNFSIIKLALKTSSKLAKRSRQDALLLPRLKLKLAIYLSALAIVATLTIASLYLLGCIFYLPCFCYTVL